MLAADTTGNDMQSRHPDDLILCSCCGASALRSMFPARRRTCRKCLAAIRRCDRARQRDQQLHERLQSRLRAIREAGNVVIRRQLVRSLVAQCGSVEDVASAVKQQFDAALSRHQDAGAAAILMSVGSILSTAD